MQRRKFIGKTSLVGFGMVLFGTQACKGRKEGNSTDTQEPTTSETSNGVDAEGAFQLSLAQWSIHNMILKDGMDPYKFAEKAKSLGFKGLEYVSGLYYPELEKEGFSPEAMDNFVTKCNDEADKYGLQNVLIMVDGQGDLASTDKASCDEAVRKHHKWVDAAANMGCHSIRVNLNGTMEKEPWVEASVYSLRKLGSYAFPKGINVLVENHGGPSSNAQWLVEVMKGVNMPNVGTLPDFGNFCVRRKDGSYYSSECIEEYDRYQGVRELMPYAQAVSAKSYDFGADGNETQIDYAKMMRIVGEAGYKGFVGVEYEGTEQDEETGIKLTRDLLIKLGAKVV